MIGPRGLPALLPVLCLGLCGTVLVLGPDPLRAQDTACDFESGCATALRSAESLSGDLGLALSGGADPGLSTSTLGRRLGGPRWALSLDAGFSRFSVRDLFQGHDVVTFGEHLVPRVEVTVQAGVIEGFSPLPTVGGVGSVDLFLSGGWIFLPEDAGGFSGRTGSFGLGARVGLLRESFTLPGVTVSAARRWHGRVRYGTPTPDDTSPEGSIGTAGGVLFDDGAVNSYRISAGKDLLGVQIFGGWGRNDTSADATLRVPRATEVARGEAGIDASREVWFLGAALDFLVVRVGAQLAWAEGSPGTGRPWTASLAARLVH